MERNERWAQRVPGMWRPGLIALTLLFGGRGLLYLPGGKRTCACPSSRRRPEPQPAWFRWELGGEQESTVSFASVCTGYVIHTQNHLRGLWVWETYSPLRPVALQLFVKLGFLTLLRKSNQEAQIREAPKTAQQMLENAGSEGCPLGSAVLPWASSWLQQQRCRERSFLTKQSL